MGNAKAPPNMRVMDMTQGNPVKLILAFAVPLFIGNIFQQIYSMVDTAVAGYCLGDGAIAAIGATSSLYALLIDFASGLNSGCAIVVTQRFGAHDEKKLKSAIAGMIELDAGITLALTVLSLAFLRPLMRFMNTPDSIFEQAYQYIAVICAGMIATIAYNLFSSILRAFGNSRTSLYFLIISSVLNMGMDLLFVAVLGLGVAGAALATVIAESVSALLCGIYVFRHYSAFLPGKADFRVSGSLLGELFSNGIAMALMYCVVDLGSVIFQRANNHLGETIISAHTASRRIIGIMMQPLATISTAFSTFVGQNWGARKPERIRTALRQVTVMVAFRLRADLRLWRRTGAPDYRHNRHGNHPQCRDESAVAPELLPSAGLSACSADGNAGHGAKDRTDPVKLCRAWNEAAVGGVSDPASGLLRHEHHRADHMDTDAAVPCSGVLYFKKTALAVREW